MLSEGHMALLIPIIVMLIPIVAILTKHQKDMAMMYQQSHQQSSSGEVEMLRRQVEELRQLVAQQTLALDDIRQMQRQLVAPQVDNLQQRLGGQ